MAEAQKRTRAGKPKTRSGCRTSHLGKLRRVKCDETKPFCSRCAQAGWECEGFAHLSDRKNLAPRNPLPIAPKGTSLQRTPIEVLLVEPTHPRFGNPNERRYFNVFQTQTAEELTGCFGFDIWNRVILQACHNELYAWHAVVAIGALHRTLELSHLPNRDPHLIKTHHTFALKQYGSALKYMRQVAQKKNKHNLRNTLISCLLTTCFESYIGNQENALTQAKAGIDLLLNWQSFQSSPSTPSTPKLEPNAPSTLDNELIDAFTRLDFQVMQFKAEAVATRPLPLSYPVMPLKFTSVTQACYYWDLMVHRVQLWHIVQHSSATAQLSTLDFGENNTSENSKDPEWKERIERELEDYEECTDDWFKAFEPLFEESRKEPGSKLYIAANMMMVRYLPSRFAITRKAGSRDVYADEYLDDYKAVVKLLKEVLEYGGAPRGRAVFTMDVAFVLSLFLVATRCREPIVRREAISLLENNPRREGLWDSLMAARVGRWLMEKEEEEMVDGKVPEIARLRIVKNDFVLKERKAVIRCSKLVEGCEERVILPDVELTW